MAYASSTYLAAAVIASSLATTAYTMTRKTPKYENAKFPDFPTLPEIPAMAPQPDLSSDTEAERDSYATKDSLKQKRSALLKTQGTRGVATLGGKSATLA